MVGFDVVDFSYCECYILGFWNFWVFDDFLVYVYFWVFDMMCVWW